MKIQNPVLRGFHPDPSICRVDDDYYIAVSTFEWFPGVMIYHSKDLAHWRLTSRPLDRLELLDMKGDPDSGGVWAPCLTYSDKRFWLVYSDIKVVEGDVWKDGNNYLTTCETIDGEWSNPVFLNSSGFDASLFHDSDGKKYLVNMVWDYRVSNHRFYGISLQEYCPTERKLVGKPEIIFKGTNLGLTEAPHLYKINGFYYLLTAEGGTGFEHASTIARSRSIQGSYEVHPENPLLTSWSHPDIALQKAGHASIVQTADGQWYLAHLTGRPLKRPGKKLLEERGYCPLGRETAIQKLIWMNDWPYVLGGNFPSLEVDAPDLPEHIWPEDFPVREHFDSPTLSSCFQTLRIPFTEEIGSLNERKSFLRLFGRESLHSTFMQALVARRWQSLDFEASTKLEFFPETYQHTAGLICFYNTRNWVYLYITADEEKGRILTIMSCENYSCSMPLIGKEITIPFNITEVYLKVAVKDNGFAFSYSFAEKGWTDIDCRFEAYKLSDDYIHENGQCGFFTGAFVGMCCQDMAGTRKYADFDWFQYEEFKT